MSSPKPRLPRSPDFVRPGKDHIAREVESLLPQYQAVASAGGTQVERWDGRRGTLAELGRTALAEVRRAAEEPEGGEWRLLGVVHGIKQEYHVGRTAQGGGNRFFRMSGVVAVPPQLFAVALLEPVVLGALDHTVQTVRVLHNSEDGIHRIVQIVAEAGPHPFFSDRDDISLTAVYPPGISGDDCYWQVSCGLPKLGPNIKGSIRIETRYWGYKLQPTPGPNGETHTKLTLVSQTEIFGWLPKIMINSIVYKILSLYVREAEEYAKQLLERGTPAKALVEAYGYTL